MATSNETESPNAAKIRELIEGFRSSPMNVRLELTKAIHEFGDEAVPYLVDGLSHDVWSVRQDCANALVSLAPPSAVPALAKALLDPDPGVCYEAARALGTIATPEALQVLTDAYERAIDLDFQDHLRDMLQGRIR